MTKSTKKTIPSTEEIEVSPPTTHTTQTGGIRKKSSFGKTFYYVDPKRTRSDKGPNQMMGIIKYMLHHKITSPSSAKQGAEIGTKAVEEGFVKTAKLTGPVIFAYYIRRMEAEQGVEHAKTVHAKTGNKMA